MEVQRNIMKGFRISKRESVKENINRILLEQIDYILKHCKNEPEDMHISIHEIRKSIKRIRAILRLIREEIGYSSYYRENVFYRDIGRSISDLRTYNVLVLMLEDLKNNLDGSITTEALEPLIESVGMQREKLLFGILSDKRILYDLSVKFAEARSRIAELPIEKDSFEVFSGGIYRMYRQGKDLFLSVRKDPSMHQLHDLRKRMKYLWYQIEIIRPIYPGPLKAYASSLENIADKLGVYHDLAVLSKYLNEVDRGLKKGHKQTLMDACEFKKEALLPDIMRMTGAALSEEPGALLHRMNEYWKIYYRQS